jgi:hypothetical protein
VDHPVDELGRQEGRPDGGAEAGEQRRPGAGAAPDAASRTTEKQAGDGCQRSSTVGPAGRRRRACRRGFSSLLGKLPDRDVTQLGGVSQRTVDKERSRRGIARALHGRSAVRWTAAVVPRGIAAPRCACQAASHLA